MPNNNCPYTIFAPSYYPRFRCIADRCRHSCCVDWEICIDEATLAKYRPLRDIMATVTECEGDACFALTADGRCPHLDERGLCRIILTHGEDYLSNICRRHPRFFNDVGGGRMEVGLGMVCEEACRLILTDGQRFTLTEIDPTLIGALPDAESDEDSPRDFDPLPMRDHMISLAQTADRTFDEICMALREAYHIPDIHTPNEWLSRFLSLEILDAAWATTLSAAQKSGMHRGTSALDAYFSRLLVYFIFRHVSLATGPVNLRARLAFALLSVDMLRRLLAAEAEQTPSALMALARRYSAEIEYSEDNTDELIFACECGLLTE